MNSTAAPVLPRAANEPSQHGLGLFAAIFAVVAWATPTLIGKALPLSSLTIVLYRGWLGVAFAMLALYLRGGRLTTRGLRYCLIGGTALGFDLMFFFAAIKTTTVANATLLSSMTPLLLIFLAPLLFDEQLSWPDWLAALAAIGGSVLVATTSSTLAGWSLRGDLLALCCLLAWTVYLSASKAVRGKIGALEFTAGVTLVASLWITPFALLHDDLTWPRANHWPLLIVMALSGWLGHVLMNWSLKHIPIWAGGTAAMAVPVAATGLAALFLDEPFLLQQGIGMAIVIGALTIVGIRSPKLLG